MTNNEKQIKYLTEALAKNSLLENKEEAEDCFLDLQDSLERALPELKWHEKQLNGYEEAYVGILPIIDNMTMGVLVGYIKEGGFWKCKYNLYTFKYDKETNSLNKDKDVANGSIYFNEKLDTTYPTPVGKDIDEFINMCRKAYVQYKDFEIEVSKKGENK